MKFFKNITGQLILGGVITALTIFFFSIYSFTDIESISVIETDTANTIDDIPSVLFSIQSETLRKENLFASFHHNFIPLDAFSAQLEEIEKREDEYYAKIRVLQKQFSTIVFLNKEEEAFSGQFEHTVDAINVIHAGIEEKMKAMLEAHLAQDETREKQIKNEIGVMENGIVDKLFSLDSAVNAMLGQRNQYVENITARMLKNSFFFMSFLFILIIGLNAYLILQMMFSLRVILKGIEASKQGNLAHRIMLYTNNEFGVIAKSFNEMAGVIEKKETALQKTVEEMRDQAQELAEKNDRLERFQKITVGRELKMIELKMEIANLKKNHGTP